MLYVHLHARLMIKHICMAPAIVMATQGVYVSTLYILRFIFYFIIFNFILIYIYDIYRSISSSHSLSPLILSEEFKRRWILCVCVY